MQEFDIKVDGFEGTLMIRGNTITLTIPSWSHSTTEITPELPDEFRLRWSIGTLEEFSRLPGFKIEADESPYLDEHGEEFDAEQTIKLYDDNHGGGGVWCITTNEFLWGISRGRHAFLQDGTILREGAINPAALEAVRQRREGGQA